MFEGHKKGQRGKEDASNFKNLLIVINFFNKTWIMYDAKMNFLFCISLNINLYTINQS